MLWLNGSNQIVKKDGLLVDCGECPCEDYIGGYSMSFNLTEGTGPHSKLYITPKAGCSEFDCQYDFSEYHCIDNIYGGDPYCEPPDEPPCPFGWHEAVYPYYDPDPPQWVIDEGKTWKIENETLYTWERLIKDAIARTTIVFSLPDGCEFVGGRVCRHGWEHYTDIENASLAISGNHATLRYALIDLMGEASYSLQLLATCRELTIDSLSIAGINTECWEANPGGLRPDVSTRRNLAPILKEWAENPLPNCQYVINEEDEFE